MYLTSFPLYSKGRICEGSDMRGVGYARVGYARVYCTGILRHRLCIRIFSSQTLNDGAGTTKIRGTGISQPSTCRR